MFTFRTLMIEDALALHLFPQAPVWLIRLSSGQLQAEQARCSSRQWAIKALRGAMASQTLQGKQQQQLSPFKQQDP
jgi:hypothetical protein